MQYKSSSLIDYLSHVNILNDILHESKKYINESYNEDENTEYNIFNGWLLFTIAYPDYFSDYAWQEPIQNKILKYFNIEPNENTYRYWYTHVMWCVYYMAGKFKRNVKDYERFKANAQSIAMYLTRLKESYDNVLDELNKMVKGIYCIQYDRFKCGYFKCICEQNINDILSKISYGNYKCNIKMDFNDDILTLNLEVNPVKNTNENYFYRVENQLKPVLSLLQENIEYFNKYGKFFSFNNRFIIE